MTKIVAISDQHGHLDIEIPECDLLLIAGDICPTRDHSVEFQINWLDTNFRWWLKGIPAKKIVGIAGNHDFFAGHKGEHPHRMPSLPWTYLQDQSTEYEGLKIYGTPWSPFFFDWSFNLYEKDLVEKWKLIPDDTDILVVHGPPHGYGDKAPRVGGKGYENTGSPGLLERIKEIKPKLVCYGHIHQMHNLYHIDELPNTILANVSLLNDRYELVNKPTVFEI